MRFLVDARLPPALARWLTARGHLADHVFDVMARDTSDLDLWTAVSAEGGVLVSKDGDFVPIARTRRSAQLLRIRVGNAANAALFAAFEAQWPEVEAALLAGQIVVEVTDAP